MDPHLVITTLVDQGVVSPYQSDALVQAVLGNDRPPEQFLVEDGHIDEHTFYQAIANSIGADYVDLSDFELDADLRDKIPVGLARLHRALPVAEVDGTLYVALADPLDTEVISELRFALSQPLQVCVASVAGIEEAITRYYERTDYRVDHTHEKKSSSTDRQAILAEVEPAPKPGHRTPLEMSEKIYVRDGGGERGPYVLQQITAMWMNGQLTADALFWFEGMEKWRPLAEFMAVEEGVSDCVEDELPAEILVEHTGTGRMVTNFPESRLYDLAYQVLEEYGVSVVDAVPGSVIVGETGSNWSSWGQAIRLDIDYHPKGHAVSVSSTSSQLYDWGRGKQDQQEIIKRLVAAIQHHGD